MWGRLGPRFALEATFLILVAVGLAIADLEPLPIVLVMGGAWLLVSLIELIASRRPAYPAIKSDAPVPEPATATEPVVEVAPPVEPAVVDPVQPVAVEPVETVEAAEPVEAVESVEVREPVEPVEPVEAIEPAEEPAGEPSPAPARRRFFGRRKASAQPPEVAAAAGDPDPKP